MFEAMVSAYPWDVLDEGIDHVLDHLHGELGATGLILWAGCAPLLHVRGREIEPRIVRSRGGLFFPPDEAHYAASRCKPMVAEGYKGKDPLRKIADACHERALTLRLVVSPHALGPIAHRHPEFACKNAWDDSSEHSLCLSNPDVQACLCGLVADVSHRFDLGACVVADFTGSWTEADSPTLAAPIPLSATQRHLLSTCFCESCRQQAEVAGVDAAAAQRAVRTLLHQSIEEGPSSETRLCAALADAGPITALERWRQNALSGLLKRLKEACRGELILDRGHAPAMPSSQAVPPSRGDHRGVPRSSAENSAWGQPDAVLTRIDNPEQLPDAWCQGAARNEIILSTALLHRTENSRIVHLATQAVERGFAALHFDNYGLLSERTFAPIKQALRIARRTTSG